MGDTDILVSRTKSGGVLTRSDIPGWEADIRDRGHHLGFAIRIRRWGQPATKTYRTYADARWASAREYASNLIKIVAEQEDQSATDSSAITSPGPGPGVQVTEALEQALSQRDDLDQYGSAKRTLFTLQLMLDLEDIHTIAATALTDGPDDKSCDLVYVDRDSRTVVIAQGYESTRARVQAPATKAASLHQAVNWLLGAQTETDVPARLRSAWKELHEALADEAIDDVEIWFVHNVPESS